MRNQFDIVVVGKNYLSLIFSLIKIQQGNSVILIDDPRVRLKGKWTSNLGPLEMNFLKLIGDEHDIKVNQRIEEFLEERGTVLYLDEKVIELTDSPYTNLIEINRKLTDSVNNELLSKVTSIDAKTFDNQINEYLTNLANTFFKYRNFQNYKNDLVDFFENNKILNLYKNDLNPQVYDNNLSKLFITSLEFLYQSYFSNNKSELDLNYLIAESLSPRKKLNIESFENELLFEYKQKGGVVKTTKVQEWHFYSEKIDSLLLESFEGLVVPKKCYYFGSIYEKSPFDLVLKKRVFRSISFEVKLSNIGLDSYHEKRLVFIQNSRVGTDFPFWEVYLDDNTLKGTYAFVNQEGAKPDFFYQNAKKDVYQSLLKVIPDLDWYLWSSNIQLRLGDDFWLEDNAYNTLKSKISAKKSPDSILKDKDSNKSLKGIEYWGPLRTQSFGLISYLMELKDYHFRTI